jgi:hypothetical protein
MMVRAHGTSPTNKSPAMNLQLPHPETAPPKGRLSVVIERLVEEFDLVAIVVGAISFAGASTYSALKLLSVPSVATVVIAGAFRIFRVRYQVERLEKSMADRIDAANRTTSDVGLQIGARLQELRSGIEGEGHHEGEVCDRSRFYIHMLNALRNATKSVDLTQLDDYAPSHYGTPEMVEYFDLQKKSVRSRPNLKFRRLVAIPTLEKLEWVLEVLESVQDCANFQISWIDISTQAKAPPPLSLQIFDRREICLVDPTLGTMRPEEQRHMLWLSGRAAAEVMAVYYDGMWNLGTRIKEGMIVYWAELDSLLTRLSAQQPQQTDLTQKLRIKMSEMSGLPLNTPAQSKVRRVPRSQKP